MVYLTIELLWYYNRFQYYYYTPPQFHLDLMFFLAVKLEYTYMLITRSFFDVYTMEIPCHETHFNFVP